MSKCHPHATVIQISYFLPSLVQTSHPSRLSPSFTSSRQAPSVSFSVCCREASNEIHTKQDGRPDAFLSTFFLSVLSFFLFILSALLNLSAFIVSSFCPSTLAPFVLLFPLFSSFLFSQFSLPCVYPPIVAGVFFCFLFPDIYNFAFFSC